MYIVDTVELKKEMIEAGVETISECADKAGISRSTLGNVLSGKTKPSTEVIFKIAAALNLDGDDITRIFFKKELA